MTMTIITTARIPPITPPAIAPALLPPLSPTNIKKYSIYIANYILEMQQYIDISSYRDTLGSDTVSIHI